jgi:hypothetical protein
MSDLLNSASLVLIPSGYKEDIVYSAVPTDGSGDMSFTRASDGTRINSAGLVEVCPWNLLQQSETFDNATWVKTRTTITANNITAPNGTTTADKWAPDGTYTATYFSLSQEVVSGATSQSHTAILYAKAGGLTQMLFYLGNQIGIYFNLSNGQFISYYNGVQTITSYNSEAVGNGWYKYTISISGNSGITYLEIYGAKSGAFVGNYTTADDCYLWGAQLNIGSTAKPYFPTTDRLNVPRLTYQNGGGGCPSLLLEKQSTNSAFPSEDFSGYTGSGATISTNQATSPDGTTNADLIYPAASGNFAGKYLNIAKSTTGVVSCFVKQASKRYAIIGTDNNSLYTCIFDLQTATVVYQATNYTGKIESFGNGWYRISAVYTSSSAADYPFIGVADNSSGGVVVDGTNGLYIWGFQYELNSSYPTSLINTTSASATRVADACFKTGISSLIGQTQGTIYGNFYVQSSAESQSIWLRKLSGGLYGDFLFMLTNNAQQPRVQVVVGGVAQFDYTGSSISEGWHKFALAYKQNDFAFYIDGVQIATNNSGTVPTCDEMYLGYYLDGGTRQTSQKEAILFPVRLTNSELASLTTI